MVDEDCSCKTDRFKACTYCGLTWESLEAFLDDREITLVGYQVSFAALELGLLLFNHETCTTTFGVPVERFRSLYAGPIYAERMAGTNECPEYCLHESELRPCPNRCECAYVREVMQIIRQRLGRK